MREAGNADNKYIEELLSLIHGEKREITDLHIHDGGAQGYSGSLLSYCTVRSRNESGNAGDDAIVTKSAVLFERKVLHLLQEKQCSVFPSVIPDIVSEERSLIYMPYLDALSAADHGHRENPVTLSVADSLAKLHCANRKKYPSFMEKTGDDFLSRLWLHAWRTQWEQNLKDDEFLKEFGMYTGRLEKAMDRFISTLQALTDEGESLTVLNVDLHPDHLRMWKGRACFIDWEQSSFGTLYLDLPNYFTIETVLTYRDALSRHGYEVPVTEFMERYHEVGRYMGLRYLGFSLWQWAQGGETRREGRWFLYYTLHLALNGR